ncbi:MAG TPA: tetratricopeptide repeat protein [Vicinamibacterales bacterium]|nr:tetratricopeptide repeat protein [Vicinamibacterales bacterium]
MRFMMLAMVLALAGCSTVASSLQYTQGTNALEHGDYERAATLLKEAVRLDPEVSRNRNNLAGALFELGRVEEGWPHVRKAVQLEPTNTFAVQNCTRYLLALLDKANLKIGAPKADVMKVLGTPDVEVEQGGRSLHTYCASTLTYDGSTLAGIGDLR